MASHVAASAFGHCLALVRDEETAARLAVVALRRGGPSLGAVLGHARHQALAVVGEAAPPAALAVSVGPSEVAWALAWTRPAIELALVDLGGRYRLGRAGLGLALRTTPSAAAARVAAVGRQWDAELDPALLAWMGPGECEELAAVLSGVSTGDPAALVDIAGEVAGHATTCPACADRLRAMPSVRHLLNSTPLPIPPAEVAAAANGSRLQPPVPPPPIDPGHRRPRVRTLAAAVVVLVVSGVTAIAVLATRDRSGETAALQALTRLPLDASSLQLAPADLEPSTGEVSLANDSSEAVSWEAAADAQWLAVSPASGRLEPGDQQVLLLQGSPPEGEVRASVRVTGDDGSTTVAAVAGTVERPPDLGAAADGCTVTADVEDEANVALTLHWRDAGGDHTAAMTEPVESKSSGGLPPATALTWWVSAIDGRGNQARTADVALPAGC